MKFGYMYQYLNLYMKPSGDRPFARGDLRMPPSVREPALRVGDEVSVAVRHFGKEYAQGRCGARWASDSVRDSGVVVEKDGGSYLVDFRDGEEQKWWQRKLLKFVSRSERVPTPVVHEASSSEGEDEQDAEASSDSSSSEAGDASDGEGRGEEGESVGCGSGWERNDEQFIDERQKQGFHTKSEPIWNTCPPCCRDAKDEDDPRAYFFETCLSWFDKTFFQEMAADMQEKGRAKGALWASWRVTVQDLWQWLGVWFYMLSGICGVHGSLLPAAEQAHRISQSGSNLCCPCGCSRS